ncbi:MAG: DUF1614 domain-containing protein [Candidatus Bathyarchaeia archaeon]
MRRGTIYNPHGNLLLAVILLVLLAVESLLLAGVVSLAFLDVGLSPFATSLILLGTFIGGFINIPLLRIESRVPIVTEEYVRFLGIMYKIPQLEFEQTTTTVAINVGGALMPTLVSIYLIAKSSSTMIWALVGSTVVAVIVHSTARPVRGIGIVTPVFIPPLAAAAIAYILPTEATKVVAYVSGTLGTLIGADLANLHEIPRLGAPLVSIGGAGTYDGIFLTGILAILLT